MQTENGGKVVKAPKTKACMHTNTYYLHFKWKTTILRQGKAQPKKLINRVYTRSHGQGSELQMDLDLPLARLFCTAIPELQDVYFVVEQSTECVDTAKSHSFHCGRSLQSCGMEDDRNSMTWDQMYGYWG